MDLISDGLLLAAAVAAIFYCFVVSRRLGGLKKQSADLTEKLGQLDATISQVRVVLSEGRQLAIVENDRLNETLDHARRLRADLRRATGALEKSLDEHPVVEKVEVSDDPVSRIRRLQMRQKKRSAS